MATRSTLVILSLLWTTQALQAADWPQFRGPDRTGVSKETGLLKSWPKEGPKLLWTYKDAGLGFSCPIIVGDMMYTMGGFDTDEYVLAIDLKTRKEQWRTKVGRLFSYRNWGDGPRSTPTIDGGKIFALGSYGDLVCLDLKNMGKEVWRKNFGKDFDGVMMSEWGFSEGVLIDGDHLICTPGGPKGTLACLKKDTGDVVWRSEGLTNKAPYSSVMAGDIAGVRQYVQNSYIDDDEKGGVTSGVDAKTGKVLWSMPIFNIQSFAIAPTPIIKGDKVYITSGYDGGCHCFEITKNGGGLKARDLYNKTAQKKVNNTHGGVILLGDHIFGHSETKLWICQNLEKGTLEWKERNAHSTKSGSIAAADGLLYLLTEEGTVVLAEPDVKKFSEVSSFPLPESSPLRAKLVTLNAAAVWTNPVIANGRLYLRDQELIFCFDVRDKK